jgi:hypothetical protein
MNNHLAIFTMFVKKEAIFAMNFQLKKNCTSGNINKQKDFWYIFFNKIIKQISLVGSLCVGKFRMCCDYIGICFSILKFNLYVC